MHLLQITEPDHFPDEIAIGIDLGTTNSLVSIAHNGKPIIINEMLPSIVAKNAVGKAALNMPHISSFKRFMGKEDFAIKASATVLKELKSQAEAYLGHKVSKAVITVPAYFDDNARNATKQAATMAGLQVLRLINEPTAAALAYGLEHNPEGIYAIYDLGGGTFDLSVLKLSKGVFQVLATGGDTQLGGDDIDALIAAHLNVDLCSAKQLKETDCTPFNAIIKPIIDKTLSITSNVLLQADISDVKEIVLVGGSTRIPMIKEQLTKLFGKAPLDHINPDTIVALGAAIQAEALTVGSDNVLLDVNPLSLGIETMGNLTEKIIYRNTPIPVTKTQEFTTYKDGQTAIVVHVVQGEGETVDSCMSLAKFELRGIPPMAAGAARVRVTFTIDADGLLVVSAKEQITGVAQYVEVKTGLH